MKRKAVVLSSGGMDSTTTMAIAIAEGFDVYSLTFNYGQRNVIEVARAGVVASGMGVADHKVVELDLSKFGGSALTEPNYDFISFIRSANNAGKIPATYVPARNTIFLSVALAWAEIIGSQDIFIGINAVDYSGYPDARPDYFSAFEKMANLATKASVEDGKCFRFHAPLIHMTKAEIIRRGLELGVNYGITSTCYNPGTMGAPCGECDSCILRAKGFREAGIDDPALKKGA